MKSIRLFLAGALLIGAGLPGFAAAQDPVLVVTDHSRGLVVTTFSENWSFSPLGRFTVNMIHNPGFSKLELDAAFTQGRTVEDTHSRHLEVAQQRETTEMVAEHETLIVGGVEATGFSYRVRANDVHFVEFWFEKNGRLYEGKLEADAEDFEPFRQEAEKILAAIEFIDP